MLDEGNCERNLRGCWERLLPCRVDRIGGAFGFVPRNYEIALWLLPWLCRYVSKAWHVRRNRCVQCVCGSDVHGAIFVVEGQGLDTVDEGGLSGNTAVLAVGFIYQTSISAPGSREHSGSHSENHYCVVPCRPAGLCKARPNGSTLHFP